jgi:hypothetical protein
MRSAFEFEDGKRMLFETSATTIIVYLCDEDWNKVAEYAHFELTSHQEDYHFYLRKMSLTQYFVKDISISTLIKK